jgi:hypothetical protein
MRTLYFYLLLALFIVNTQAQISVSPPALFMNSNNRFGTFIVENKTGEPQEVTVKFRFGYPASDSIGNLSMQYDDSIAEAKYSLTGWIKGFPRKFVLMPGTQQIIRLTTQPPENLSDGMYWSRIITSAQAQAKRIDTVRTGITTQINIVFEQITTVLYAKGALNTDIEISDPIIVEDSSNVRIVWKTIKKGNAPYFGTAKVKVFDETGNVVDETIETLGIYMTMNKKASFDRIKLKPGKYIAEIAFITERNDIASENIIQLPQIVKKFAFTIK